MHDGEAGMTAGGPRTQAGPAAARAGRGGEDPPQKGGGDAVDCPRCNGPMLHMQACHMFCPNCGAHLDCSDKGGYW